MEIGKYVKAERKKAGLTQEQLAEGTGLSVVTIRQYEQGKRQPRFENLERIASCLGVSLSSLFGIDEAEAMLKQTTKQAEAAMWEVLEYIHKQGIGSKEDFEYFRSQSPFYDPEIYNDLRDTFLSLSDEGVRVAVERVKELAEIPRYQRHPDKSDT